MAGVANLLVRLAPPILMPLEAATRRSATAPMSQATNSSEELLADHRRPVRGGPGQQANDGAGEPGQDVMASISP